MYSLQHFYFLHAACRLKYVKKTDDIGWVLAVLWYLNIVLKLYTCLVCCNTSMKCWLIQFNSDTGTESSTVMTEQVHRGFIE